ncbi:MAG: ribonuclease HII, partial [Lachnospiraceae bacterium]|nr:ribonuclease HII [Lachnospiraceae bacterium]
MSKSIKEIQEIFENADMYEYDSIQESLKDDERAGVIKLIMKYNKKKKAFEDEVQRIFDMKEFERKYSDYQYICGIDEVGRGPLAGPVCAGAVILPKDAEILYVNDSKKLSGKKREELYKEITEQAIAYKTVFMNHEVIDEINILQATYKAMRQAVNELNPQPDLLLIDAVHIPELEVKQVSIIKGDAKSFSIAAASIVAKVERDHLMEKYDELYPEYGFAGNKGYGSKEHIEAIK